MLELLFELVVQVLGEALLALGAEAGGAAVNAVWWGVTGRSPPWATYPRAWVWSGVAGMAVATLSILVHPMPAALPRAARIALLVFLPLATGALPAFLARFGQVGGVRRGFWIGFAFGLGYVLWRVGVTALG